MDAFDSDALIYAAIPAHPLGRRVRAVLRAAEIPSDPAPADKVGSVLLLPELLSKPRREQRWDELEELSALLARLDLVPLDADIADLAVGLGATHHLRAADAVHLATAVALGADRFITNNRRGLPRTITEVDITYPDDLPDPAG
jgi:predicted nucleic acid-binding protein